METDDESTMFNEFMKPSITQVEVDFNSLEEKSGDEYQLKNLNDVFSCTMDEPDYMQNEPYYERFSDTDFSENLVQAASSSLQMSDDFLASMTSYNMEAKILKEELDESDNLQNLNEVSTALIDDDELEQVEYADDVYLTSEDESNAAKNVFESDDSENMNKIDNESVPAHEKKRKYNEKEKLTKKRSRKPENWEKNKRKAAVQQGLEYTNLKTQEVAPARALKRSCGPGCRYKCEEKIDETRRKKIFELFYSTDSQSAKHIFITRYVSEKSTSQENNSRKSFSRTYTLTNHEAEHVTVCKTMFINTLSISKKVVDTALKKNRGDVSLIKDMRGSSSRKIPQAVTDSVIEHINMFRRVESHYARNDSKREYLEENLSLSSMYRLYTDWTKEKNKPKASKHHYDDVFNTQFNIGFFKPKKDQCDLCEKFKNATESETPSLEKEYNLHIENKSRARLEKKNDTQYATEYKEKTSVICFDFEKILSTPKSECSCLYYKRKLSVYNFTIYDIVRHKAYCYVWSEHEAKRGSNEVASCLLLYFEMMVSHGVDTFLLYSDNCSGQNRNKYLFSMYTYASSKLNIDIKHTFLVVGHTQNEGDNVHAQIERYTKGRRIYSPSEWCKMIVSTKENDPKYDVINVTWDMIYDFKELAGNQNWHRISIKNGKKSSVGVSKFKIIRTFKTHSNQIEYKTAFDEDYVTLATRKEKEQANVKKYKLRKAYDGVQGIPIAKLKDLLSLCKNNIIPPVYHDFYNSLTARSNNGKETENTDDEREENN